jgi:glycosyltransferase involved in cell wall biosynthesis
MNVSSSPMESAKSWGKLLYQRTRENIFVVHSGLFLFLLFGFLQAAVGRKRNGARTLAQVHRTTRWSWMRGLAEPFLVSNRSLFYGDPAPPSSPKFTKFLGRRLLVLKPPVLGGEKGVLFVSFSDMFRLLSAYVDMNKLLSEYTLVFEPSYPGFCHPEMLKYTLWPDEIFVLAGPEEDLAFLRRLNSNLVPLAMGPADWVDPRISLPYLGAVKEFDIVMNAGWMSLKRHYALFRMLAKAKRKYRTLLIGFGAARKEIESLIKLYGVGDQVAILEDIPYEKVMEMTCRSRVSMLLSLKEGGNRAVAESMFCNVPVIISAAHVGGVRKNVVPETGLLVEDRDLEAAVEQLMNSNLRPRDWAVENISCFKSSEKLNNILREHAFRKGLPWTVDIAARSNSPDSSYTCAEDTERLRPWNEGLIKYLKQ